LNPYSPQTHKGAATIQSTHLLKEKALSSITYLSSCHVKTEFDQQVTVFCRSVH
jgi:hypothetical protein